MVAELTAAQVQALAPDPSSVAAARKLAKPVAWKSLGRSDQALWGECQGSALYKTQVAASDLSSQCSCPSRKLPCKHALGLLLLAVERPDQLQVVPEPDWVSLWLEKRRTAQTRKLAAAQKTPTKPVDAAAQAKRAEKRQDNVLAGLDQLDAWLSDLLRQGLARAQGEPPSYWDNQARRMVDAQAPGLAGRIRQMGELVGSGEQWTARLLDELGSLSLLSHAYRRLHELAGPLAADVRRLIGFTLDQAEVIRHGDLVDDDWLVLADHVEEDERLRSQRVWLRGRSSGRTALVLQFTPAGAAFKETLPVGTRVNARLAFWPSACPQRALVIERQASTTTYSEAELGGGSVSEHLARFAEKLGRLPWLHRDLFVLPNVVPVLLEGSSEQRLAVLDAEQQALPLRGSEHALLLALSGGRPVSVIGEWSGYTLKPLVVWQRGRGVPLTFADSEGL